MPKVIESLATAPPRVRPCESTVVADRAEDSPYPRSTSPGGFGRSALLVALGAILLVGNLVSLTGTYVPYVVPLLGLACAIGIPSALIFAVLDVPDLTDRLGLSILLALLSLIGAGLIANTVLPHLGAHGPLGHVDVIVTTDVLCLALGAGTWSRHAPRYHFSRQPFTTIERRLLGLSAALVPMAAMGAVRLNNGLGGGLTLVMLSIALIDIALVIALRTRLRANLIPACIYCISLALLLMTSLRGWYTTGHDIQRETRVFLLTQSHASWNISRFRDAYNACLSITILPTMLWQWMRVDTPYIYKIPFQLLFALCPVLVYRLASRFADRLVALLATVYFVSFVTFFQDMPMINRQEIAFIFLTAGLVILFEPTMALRRRRVLFCLMAVGMVLSHYSTTYIMVALLLIAWLARSALTPIVATVGRRRAWIRQRFAMLRLPKERALGLGSVVFVVAVAFLWSGPLTHTQSDLTRTVGSALASLRGGSGASRSLDTNYSIVSTSEQTPEQLLALYNKDSIQATAAERAKGVFYSAATVSAYPTPPVADAQLPLTAVGRFLSRLGLNVASFNSSVRQGSAFLLQVLIILGLLIVAFGHARRAEPTLEYVCLAGATLVIVLLQVFLPVLSVSYGLLRTFQQALIVLGVFLAIGSLALVPRRLGALRVGVATGIALAFFASSTGIVTQTIGGYGPQLHLNNAGQYYDIYYLHPQEIAGIRWLEDAAQPSVQNQVQAAEIQTDRYTFNRFSSVTPLSDLNDITPSLVRRNSYVFLGYSNVRNSESTISFSGDLLTYHYPLAFLDNNKDLIYNNGGSRVYR